MQVNNTYFTPEHSLVDGRSTKLGNEDANKTMFLNLLVTQLEHQDPLNPMDDKDFTAQLAQFSSLEQLEKIGGGIEDLNAGFQHQEMFGAVGYIGKEVRSYGDSVSKEADGTSTVYYDLQSPVKELYVNIYDADGIMVASVPQGARQPGSYEFSWDGKDYSGDDVPSGVYGVAISAEDGEGAPVMVYTEVSGQVAGVTHEGGEQYLRLKDGRYVNLLNVKEVVDTTANTTQTDNDGAGV